MIVSKIEIKECISEKDLSGLEDMIGWDEGYRAYKKRKTQ